ncbi:MAG TPA: hypothetical protein RMG45_10065, partial [Polyangiaceae bacterium LLY-WYZ-15_(1-7)]|nr:hypothetical protein [Polyangiaceae bacterium LLY-WYZ-15_(1-7)]
MTTASRPGSERLPRERARRDPDESWLVPVLVALVASLLLHAVGFPAFMGLVDRLGWLQPVAAIPPPPEPVDMDIVVPEPEPEP